MFPEARIGGHRQNFGVDGWQMGKQPDNFIVLERFPKPQSCVDVNRLRQNLRENSGATLCAGKSYSRKQLTLLQSGEQPRKFNGVFERRPEGVEVGQAKSERRIHDRQLTRLAAPLTHPENDPLPTKKSLRGGDHFGRNGKSKCPEGGLSLQVGIERGKPQVARPERSNCPGAFSRWSQQAKQRNEGPPILRAHLGFHGRQFGPTFNHQRLTLREHKELAVLETKTGSRSGSHGDAEDDLTSKLMEQNQSGGK